MTLFKYPHIQTRQQWWIHLYFTPSNVLRLKIVSQCSIKLKWCSKIIQINKFIINIKRYTVDYFWYQIHTVHILYPVCNLILTLHKSHGVGWTRATFQFCSIVDFFNKLSVLLNTFPIHADKLNDIICFHTAEV